MLSLVFSWYYTRLCVRNLPIELIILSSIHTQWSYGVTVWEILTLAEMPYSDVDNNRGVFSSLMMGQRLPQPPDCPDTL